LFAITNGGDAMVRNKQEPLINYTREMITTLKKAEFPAEILLFKLQPKNILYLECFCDNIEIYKINYYEKENTRNKSYYIGYL
jgi:hypothetical protein